VLKNYTKYKRKDIKTKQYERKTKHICKNKIESRIAKGKQITTNLFLNKARQGEEIKTYKTL